MSSKEKEIHTVERIEKTKEKQRVIRITTTEREIVVTSNYAIDSVKHLEQIACSLFDKSKENRDRSDVR